MSFYVGRHRLPNGTMKRQMHITASEQELGYMQGGIQPDTVFHTDQKYVEYRIVNNITAGYFQYRQGGRAAYVGDCTSIKIFKNPDLLSYIRNGHVVLFVTAQDSIFATNGAFQNGLSGTQLNEIKYSNTSNGYFYYNGSKVYQDNEEWVHFGEWRGSVVSRQEAMQLIYNGKSKNLPVKAIVLNIDVYGNHIGFRDTPLNPNEIMISNSTFSINGLDLFTVKYVSGNNLLGWRKITSPDGLPLLYLSNVESPGTGMKLETLPGRTKIWNDSRVIIDTDFPFYCGSTFTNLSTYNFNITATPYAITSTTIVDLSSYYNKMVIIGFRDGTSVSSAYCVNGVDSLNLLRVGFWGYGVYSTEGGIVYNGGHVVFILKLINNKLIVTADASGCGYSPTGSYNMNVVVLT